MEETGEVLPFFILDEMTPSRDIPNMMKLAAFQRNVFRACGLVVIVMGTDSKISDLVSQSYHGRTDSHWWMSVVSRFPPYQSIASGGSEKDDAWQKVTQLHPVVNHIAEHSRGLFSRCFVDAVVHFALKKIAGNETFALADLLDAAFKAVYVKAQAAKGFMTTPKGRCAQLMALSYTNASGEHPHYAISGDDMSERASTKRRKLDLDVGVANMHLHFANLIDEEITDVVVSRGNLEYQLNGRPWSPICRFPVVEEDVLLYLAVLGGKKFSAYHNYKAEKRHSVVGVFKDFRKQCGSETHENKKAPRNDFSEFENLVAHAIFCASRMNGVRGIAFNEFFSVLIGEFRSEPYQREESNQTEESKQSEQTDQTEKFDSSALLEKYDRLKEKFTETRIPFLAPPNARWPDYILRACGNGDCDCNFGHLVRAKDEERLDCYVMVPGNDNPLFICECKHWKKKLDSGAMEKIIEGLNAEYKGRPGRDGHRKRKWNNWDLAFVFCDEITQFQQAKMDAWGFPGTGIVTVDCKTWVYNYPVVKWIIKPNAGEKLVIVVQTGRLFLSGISGVVK
ncbi:hypothetical protein DVH05_003656 [Phytophthora capsici]|nr:hypothetical protein DVH05_003656 [Phytophthora capsici]